MQLSLSLFCQLSEFCGTTVSVVAQTFHNSASLAAIRQSSKSKVTFIPDFVAGLYLQFQLFEVATIC